MEAGQQQQQQQRGDGDNEGGGGERRVVWARGYPWQDRNFLRDPWNTWLGATAMILLIVSFMLPASTSTVGPTDNDGFARHGLWTYLLLIVGIPIVFGTFRTFEPLNSVARVFPIFNMFWFMLVSDSLAASATLAPLVPAVQRRISSRHLYERHVTHTYAHRR